VSERLAPAFEPLGTKQQWRRLGERDQQRRQPKVVNRAGIPDFSQQAESFQIAVTGGTGAYDGAIGQVEVHENGEATHEMALVLPEED
jgi:hypothetical protein